MRARFPTGGQRAPLPAQSPVPTKDNLVTETTFVSEGRLQGGDPADDGWVLDLQGLRFYNAGVATIELESDGGSLTFTGTISGATIDGATITGGVIRTASSGGRIQFAGGSAQVISFFTGNAAETANGSIFTANAALAPFVSLQSPIYNGKRRAALNIWGEAHDSSIPESIDLFARDIRFIVDTSDFNIHFRR